MKEYVDLLRALIRVPSVSGSEKEAADVLQAFLESRGHTVHRRFDNVWVESEPEREGRPTILLNAHLDTVAPTSTWTRNPFGAELDGDVLYGLGANDDGGSLVALLAGYEKLSATPQPYRLVFSATAQEENCGPEGIDAALPEFGNVAFGIIAEPTGMRMALAEKGLMVLDCTTHGVAGHAAREEGVNALYEALADIEWFRTFRFEKVSEFLGPVRMSVTMISAGTQHNVVPDVCRFTVDVRSNGEYSNQEILDVIRSYVRCDVEPRSMKHNSSSVPVSNPVVRRGLSLGLEAFGSPTTSNQTRCPFPTFKIGPGESERSHKSDEYILVSEIAAAVDIYYELLDGIEL